MASDTGITQRRDPQPDALASAQAPVECPQAEEGSRDDAGTQLREGERFADPVRVPDRRMDRPSASAAAGARRG